jgi:cyclopropane-fatty-acyl-phospholipid synthase
LRNLDQNKSAALQIFENDQTPAEAKKTFHRWRIFFLACAETFAYGKGQEWWVSHYLFSKPARG